MFRSVMKAVQHFAEQTPTAVAVRGQSTQLDYHELAMEVENLVKQLQPFKAKVMALWMDNSPAWVVSDLAALSANIPLIPLPLFFSHEQMVHAIRQSACELMVSDHPAELEKLLHLADIEILHEVSFLVAGQVLTVFHLSNKTTPVIPPATCKITFTSGTTGQPKGVCLSERHLIEVASSLQKVTQASAADTHLCVLPLSTLLENVAGNYVPLMTGACMVTLPLEAVGLTGSSGFQVQVLMQALHREQATTLILTPELLLAMVMAIEAGMPTPASLRFVAVGGASVSPALLKRAMAVQLPVFEGYGLSECGSVVTLNTPISQQLGTVGQVLPHLQVRIAPHGEVMVKGGHFLGYLGDAPSTFTTSEGSSVDAHGWLATGDLGQLNANGTLTIVGRIKHMFITSFGRNVSPEWVERALNGHPLIAQSILFGEAMPRNTAVIVLRNPETPLTYLEEAITEINATLPDYARVGHYIVADQAFTVSNGMLTANGRLKRQAIWQHYAARVLSMSSHQETGLDNAFNQHSVQSQEIKHAIL